jgi:hypothetical protein
VFVNWDLHTKQQPLLSVTRNIRFYLSLLQAIAAMSVSVKCADLIRQFDGEGEDFAVWIRKVELVASLQGVERLEKFVPLFLVRGAFAVFESLEDVVKDDYGKLKAALTRAFSLGQLKAYDEFVERRLYPNESVDVYVADLRRLAGLVVGRPEEEWLKCATIRGLPDEVRRQLIAACSLEKMGLQEVIVKARSLLSNGPSGVETSAVANIRRASHRRCFLCNQVGHIARECETRNVQSNGVGSRGTVGNKKQNVVCYQCGMMGHFAAECTQRMTKNA